MSAEETIIGSIKIDIAGMRELVDLAARRASAFVRLGLDGLEDRGDGDFNLTASLVYRFWPEDIPEETRLAAREEYRAWLIGSCLRELDLFYGLFLDKLWFAIEVAELHGTMVRSDHVFDQKFSRKTNVAAKQREVASKLDVKDYYDELNSLSLARNALTHHAGVVRAPFDCNNEARDSLSLKWLAFDMLAGREGENIVVDHAPFDTHVLPGDGPVQISLRFTPREMLIPAWTAIHLTHPQIAEMCMFYKILCDRMINGYTALLHDRGIVRKEPAEGAD